MDCSACGQPNPEGARFCGRCGGALIEPRTCANCGTAAAPGDRFCTACGHALEGDGPSSAHEQPAAREVSGERKQVTVLFADVKGSMDLAGSLDPEEWRAIMNRFLAILRAGIERFDGTVDKFTGDGVMALFGAPLAYEDHAIRACYAALSLHEELGHYANELRRERGLSFSVRMGLNSGEVVVGAMGDDAGLPYTAIGHTVGLAQRMESLAEPGRAYLTGATAELAGGYLELRDLGQFNVKGVAEPVRVFQLEGVGRVRTRLEAAAARGFTRFVGRREEMAELEHAWELAAGGDGQVVGVVAEAGVGKSRLCREFAERRRAEGIEVHEAHGLAHAHTVPFLPVLEVVRGYFGIGEGDGDRTAQEKVAGRLLLLDPELTEVLPLIFEFLGVPDPARPAQSMTPEARRRQLFGAFTRLQLAQRARAPDVLLVEDLHWLDPGSEMFLASLVESVPGTGALVLVTFRPEYAADWMKRSYFRRLPLPPLGEQAIHELLTELLGSDPSLDGLAERIRERAGGNPFFIEEVVQALAQEGALAGAQGAYRLAREIDRIAIPPTVQSILAARIDRLAEREKGVLQAASVVGREFAAPVLERVVSLPDGELQAALRELVAGEFVHQRSLYPVAEYAFKHALTEDVAYNSQLSVQRRKIHAAVAAALEQLESERLDERAGLLAHHWRSAAQTLEAARWSARAAAWAGYTDQMEAVRHWRSVRELTAGAQHGEPALLGLTARAMLLGFAWRLGRLGGLQGEVDALFAEGETMAEGAGAPQLRAVLLASYAGAMLVTGRVTEALEIGRLGMAIADASGDIAARLAVLAPVAYPLMIVGKTGESLELAERLLAAAGDDRSIGAGLGWARPYGWAVMWRGGAMINMGRLAEGRAQMERSMRMAREDGDVENLLWSHNMMVLVLECEQGDGEQALAHARAACELAERAGGVFAQAWSQYYLGIAHLLGREWHQAIDAFAAASTFAQERGTALEGMALFHARLSQALLGSGDAAGAQGAAREALELALQHGARMHEIDSRLALARSELALRGEEAAAEVRRELEAALSTAEQTSAFGLEPRVRAAMAELARAVGDAESAERELALGARLREAMCATSPGAGTVG